jgi:chorismate mutase
MTHDDNAQFTRDLEAVRRDVREIDQQIIIALKKRELLVKEVVIFKNSPSDITDPRNVLSLLQRVDLWAEEHGVSTELARGVYEAILNFVIPRQLALYAELKSKNRPS